MSAHWIVVNRYLVLIDESSGEAIACEKNVGITNTSKVRAGLGAHRRKSYKPMGQQRMAASTRLTPSSLTGSSNTSHKAVTLPNSPICQIFRRSMRFVDGDRNILTSQHNLTSLFTAAVSTSFARRSKQQLLPARAQIQSVHCKHIKTSHLERPEIIAGVMIAAQRRQIEPQSKPTSCSRKRSQKLVSRNTKANTIVSNGERQEKTERRALILHKTKTHNSAEQARLAYSALWWRQWRQNGFLSIEESWKTVGTNPIFPPRAPPSVTSLARRPMPTHCR